MLGVLVLVALGAYAYLYWWSKTPDHGFFDTIPAVQRASEQASRAVVRSQVPAQPGAPGVVNPGTEGTPAVPSTTYRTYANTQYSFSFAYPDNWDVSESTQAGVTTVCIATEGGNGPCLVTLRLEKESVNVSAEKTLAALRTEFRAGNVSESSRRIGGVEAEVLRVGGYPAGAENSTRAAVFVKDQWVYTLETASGQEAIFDRVADSFLFTM